jgi:H+/Cl- antiporter ClcA/predicted transcriptional regulator
VSSSTSTTSSSYRRLVILCLLAGLLGLAGGAAAWVLIRLIRLLTSVLIFHEWSFSPPTMAHLDPGPDLVVVAVLGAIVISLIAKWAPLIKGHGIPEAMEAILLRQSRVTPRTAVAKPVSAALAIGTGGPFGAEGPIIVTGSAIGSLIGQVLRVSASERKILLAAGAAAGMAATFGAPLASVVLAVEILLFEFSTRAFIPLVISASIAGGMHGLLFEDGPLFAVPPHDYAGIDVLPLFVLLGLVSGVYAVIISKGLYVVEDLYRRLPIGEFWHPPIGAVIFACVGLLQPRALGVGYDVINDFLGDRLAVGAVALIVVAKIIAWWFALGSGTSGGTLAPILLMSSGFGVLAGHAVDAVLPGLGLSPGAFAVVAMAATFGAATRATFTSIVFVFELTRDYEVILPLMLATVMADLVARRLMRDSIFTEKLTRRGLHVRHDYEVDQFRVRKAREIMTEKVETFPHTAKVQEVRARFAQGGHSAYPVMDGDRCIGTISRGDLLLEDPDPADPVSKHVRKDVVTAGLDDFAIQILERMLEEHTEQVLVIDDGALVGICTRSDLLAIRERQLAAERAEDGHWSLRSRLRLSEG